jgi:predicted TIM-barrel fold metal-dependent hydrolase
MKDSNYIDAHVHVWTDDTAHYPLARGYKVEDMNPKRFTPEDLFKHTKPAGVNRINLIQMSYYRYEKRLTVRLITLQWRQRSDSFFFAELPPCQRRRAI